MRIYADTSFLVALLCRTDKAHTGSRNFFIAHASDEWLTSSWSLFETRNAIRQLCLMSGGISPEQAEAVLRLFRHWHRQGNFVAVAANLNETAREAQQLSAMHATTLRMRAADVVHIALLEEINPDLFVTRDKDQHALALARAFPARLLP